jgi:hypothetical protein
VQESHEDWVLVPVYVTCLWEVSMLYAFERLLPLRSAIKTQIEDLESGRVKALELYNGDRSDDDCSLEHLANLRDHLVEIDAVLSENCIGSTGEFECRAGGRASSLADQCGRPSSE